MGEEKQFQRRSTMLVSLFVLCLMCFCALLYKAQVLNYAEHLGRSTTQVTTTETVEAHRGILIDRNGKLLVSNREIYSITLNPDLIPQEEGMSEEESLARAVLRLVELCREKSVTWTDTLPLSTTRPYFYTLSTASDTSLSRFQRFLSKQGWTSSEVTRESGAPTLSLTLQTLQGSDTLTANILLDLMAEHYAIPEDFTSLQKRLVCGVLYELELRTMDPNYYIAPYVFAEDVSVELISILNDGLFHGTVVESRSVRQYHTEYAAHVLGRIADISSKEERETLNASALVYYQNQELEKLMIDWREEYEIETHAELLDD